MTKLSNRIKNKNRSGAALLIYLLIMVFVIAILMTATYSRLLQSVKRGQSSTDNLATNYEAESEVYDVIARLAGNYISSSAFPFTIPKTIGNTKLTIVGTQEGNTQTISVTANRPFSSTKIVGVRNLEQLSAANKADILLGLDCTGSMNDRSTTGNNRTRISNLKSAALNFVNNIPTDGSIRLGVYVFGVNAKWLKTSDGQDVDLESNLGPLAIADALNKGLGEDWQSSPACHTIMDSTSIGTAFKFAQDYFKDIKKSSTKQVEIVITDGEPNSRIPDPGCTPNIYCPSQEAYCSPPYTDTYGSCDTTYNGTPVHTSGNICKPTGVQFMGCQIASKNTHFVYTYNSDGTNYSFDNVGLRDPDIDAYAVTISLSPDGQAVDIFNTYIEKGNFIKADKANELPGILSKILTDIITKKETIKIHKELPGQ